MGIEVKRVAYWMGIASFLLIIFIVLFRFVTNPILLPESMKLKIVSKLEMAYPNIRLSIGSLRISFLPTKIFVYDLDYTQGNPADTQVRFQVPKLSIEPNIFELFDKHIFIRKIYLTAPVVTILEGDLVAPQEVNNKSSKIEGITVQSTTIETAQFEYIRVHKLKRATIHIESIEAQIDELGNYAGRESLLTHGEARGILEGSGKFNLKLAARVFQAPLHLDVFLQMENLNLNKINSYFMPSSGIHLKGFLQTGKSEIYVRGNALRGYVDAVYSGLDFHFFKTEKRSAFSAFFSNLLKGFKVRASDKGEKKVEQKRFTNLERNKNDTLVRFIFRGMGDAATKLVQ